MNDDPNLERKTAFERIYSANEWGSNESRSGLGSNLDLTRQVRRALPPLLRGLGVKSMLDAPCGDYNWMPHVDLGGTHYIGCDIVPELIAANRARHPGIEFLCVDLAEGNLPQVDLIFSRDCLQHLPEADIWKVLRNFKRSGARWLLTSSHTTHEQSMSFYPGGFGYLNLQLAPFNFPRPVLIVPEEHYASKAMALWPMSEVRG